MTPAATRIGGVPVYVVDAGGPPRALLAFRVGRADEPLPLGGLTHLVEHLALLSFREQPYAYGGQVEGARTVFWVEGTQAQMAEFFTRLCQNLETLPLDRLADEARLLETEARSRKPSVLEALLGARYGARSWGAIGWPEYGLRRADPDRVRAWARRWFTSENAALGIAGTVPAGLTLGLPSGTRMPPPASDPLPLTTPAWMHESYPGIAIGLIGPRSPRFSGLMRSLERHGRERLRFEESLSYEVSSGMVRLSPDEIHATLWADGLAENLSKVWVGLLHVIDELMERGPTQAELHDDIESLRKSAEQPGWSLSVLDGQISGELLSKPPLTLDEWVATLEASTPADYAALLKEVFPSMLAVVATSVAVLDQRFTAVPMWSSEALVGRDYELRVPKSAAHKEMTHLTVSEEGVSLRPSPGKVVTIRYPDCVAALTWDDGSRTLVSVDSFRIHVRPADWAKGEAIATEIDKHLAPDVLVPRGPRPNPDHEALSETAPAPKPLNPQATKKRSRSGFNWRAGLIAGAVLILIYIAIAIVAAPR